MDVVKTLKIDSKNIKFLLLILIFIKLILLGLFSSHYQTDLFIPFTNHFINNFDNPWEWAYSTSSGIEFPYHPLMLYAFSIGAIIIKLFHITNIFWVNFIFKLPLFIADLGIFYLFYKLYIKNESYKAIYYFISPIILYSIYMHSQLDIVPVAILFYSFYLVKKRKIYQSSLWCAVSICFKSNAVLLVPILLSYIAKNFGKLKAFYASLMMAAIYFIVSFPYIFSKGYQSLVLFNQKQSLFFNLHIDLNNLKIYIPILCVMLLYFKFASYKKVNNSLLDSFCCLVVSSFLIFVPPSSPAWFVWLIPFLVLLVINYVNKNKNVLYAYSILNVSYLIYFIFFHVGDFGDLIFLNKELYLKINNPFLINCAFTLLIAALVSIIYLTYKIGIKSNKIYKKEKALLIGIGGNSGSGKSTLLHDLQNLFGSNLLTLEGDGAHRWERGNSNWKTYTHLDPKANELHQQMETLVDLKNFKSSSYKDYNHNTGKFEIIEKINPAQFIAIAGLHTFYLPKMRRLIDLKIYLNTDEKIRLHWKEQRDIKERGYNSATVNNANKSREKDSLKYILPQRDFADLIISYFVNKEDNESLSLRVDIDSSFSLEDIIKYFENKNIDFKWDYSDDLKTQYIELNSEVGMNDFDTFLHGWIENIDEIVTDNYIINNGYRGFIQCVILKMISDNMRGENV